MPIHTQTIFPSCAIPGVVLSVAKLVLICLANGQVHSNLGGGNQVNSTNWPQQLLVSFWCEVALLQISPGSVITSPVQFIQDINLLTYPSAVSSIKISYLHIIDDTLFML